MITIFPVVCPLIKLEIMLIQSSVIYLTSGITLDVLILTLPKIDQLLWYGPNCAMETLFSVLSNNSLKLVLLGDSFKTLAKSI